MRTRAALIVTMMLGMVACGQAPSGAASTSATPSVPPGSGQAVAPVIDDISPLNTYAAEHADEFAGLYMHPPGSGLFVMLFTANVEEHAAALAGIASNVTVRSAAFTEAELIEILESLMQSLRGVPGVEPVSGALDTRNNVVTLDVKTNDLSFELLTELQYGGRVDVTVYPVPGPWANVEAGPGWRLLTVARASGNDAHAVYAATTAPTLTTLWDRLDADGPVPAIDFNVEVVVAFAHGIGSSCPELRLDGVVIADGEVLSVTSDPLSPRACTADLVGAETFLVAVERDALPAGGFTLWLSESAKAYTQPLEVELR